ncbi:MAG: hypothetical protein QW505_03180 [Thermoplasmata archaeon]
MQGDMRGKERVPISKLRNHKIKLLALSLCGVMAISTLAIALPGMVAPAPIGKIQASSSPNNGGREVHYNFTDFFHMTFQDWNWNRSGGVTFETAGRHESDPTDKFHDRMPTWYFDRQAWYSEMIYREEYPHIFYYMPNPYSIRTTPDVSVGPVPFAPLRFSVWARNITDCRTTNDAIFVPDLNPVGPNGGWINVSYYMTCISVYEHDWIKSSNTAFQSHWISWLYGVEGRTQIPPNSGGTENDGFYVHFMGKIEYSRQAAMSYLGWDGTGNVQTWFLANEENIEQNAWRNDWVNEGSAGGQYDIYTAYGYDNSIKVISLQLDSLNSTADTLTIRVYAWSWGMDILVVRWLEAAGVLKNAFQNWMEDMDLNVRISPNMMNLSLSAVANYAIEAWEDEDDDVWCGGWSLENYHIDYCGNEGTHTSYPSPYNNYDPDQTDWLIESRAVWTKNFSKDVSYWGAPLEKDLGEYEYINIQLNADDVIGFRPGKGVADADPTYVNNLRANQYWGRMVLGKDCWPYDIIAAAYDPATKTIRLEGPIDFPTEIQPGTTDVLISGIPSFMFDVSPVAYYAVSVTGPHTTGLQDTITVTGYNATGAIMPNWYNGTVVLGDTDPDTDPAEASHTWQTSDNGVWRTNITWLTAGTRYIDAADQWFNLDVKGSSGPISIALIPEFSTLLIPTMGAIAVFLILRSKTRRNYEM